MGLSEAQDFNFGGNGLDLALRAASLLAALGFYGSIEVGNKSHLAAYLPMRR
jgi:hypothetical protein